MYDSKIKKSFQELLWEENIEGTEGEYEAEWIVFAEDSSHEMNALLDLFYAEKDPYYKWRLACALVELGQTQIASELKKYLNHEDERMQARIAWCLVGLEDVDGGGKLLEVALKSKNQRQFEWFLTELREEVNNSYAHKLAAQLVQLSCFRNIEVHG